MSIKYFILIIIFISHADIKDSCRNLMKKWNGVNTTNGVFSGEYQLSDLPSLGEWKITAAIADQVCFKFYICHIFLFNFPLSVSNTGENSCR